MKCWYCDNPARGICHVCGRGLCKGHVHENEYSDTLHCEIHKH